MVSRKGTARKKNNQAKKGLVLESLGQYDSAGKPHQRMKRLHCLQRYLFRSQQELGQNPARIQGHTSGVGVSAQSRFFITCSSGKHEISNEGATRDQCPVGWKKYRTAWMGGTCKKGAAGKLPRIKKKN